MTGEPTEPIVVRESPAKEVSAQTVRVILLGGFSAAASQFVRSEIALGAIVPALGLLAGCVAGFVVTYVIGLKKLLKDHRQRRLMARHLPDDVAHLK